MRRSAGSLIVAAIFILSVNYATAQSGKTARELGINIGVMKPGNWNAITDVAGVKVGHITLVRGDSVRTGATAIIPHEDNLFQSKTPAAIFRANGFGKLAGSTQVDELGNLETPVLLTNTLAVADAMQAIIDYTLLQPGNENIQSVNALVGETNDGWLNDIRGRHLTRKDIIKAIASAKSGEVEQGAVGAGTGTVCFGFKGGIGSSSRKLPETLGGYTVGVLVQSNFGGVLQVNGVPVGEELGRFSFSNQLLNNVDGSCMIVVATDAPLDARNLERLAKRAFLGLAKTGGIASNGSGDYVIAFSTFKGNRIPHDAKEKDLPLVVLHNDYTTPVFMAAIEATEEAIINSMLMATTTKAKGKVVDALTPTILIPILKKYNRLQR
ncbi:P1 family peptidase [Flavihumibacter sp. ZG627]|uniref:P1 family peptidase n=1 Tax=Flavihumibacter sp. ZG627 TaxID=1463156 RepID=UPI00057E61A5|nr:P1 family peptidase [Flavihumibacter sp. ZG627]KIC89984.1 D-aminopeptidase [Flavihumibacter sp. ZG627]